MRNRLAEIRPESRVLFDAVVEVLGFCLLGWLILAVFTGLQSCSSARPRGPGPEVEVYYSRPDLLLPQTGPEPLTLGVAVRLQDHEQVPLEHTLGWFLMKPEDFEKLLRYAFDLDPAAPSGLAKPASPAH